MKTLTVVLGAAWMLAMAGNSLAADPEHVARGEKLFQYWCATCHGAEPREGGRFLPGTASLMAKYKGEKPAALEQRTDLLPAYVEVVIRHGSAGMPFFRKTEISNADMEAIAAYLARNTK
jgi:mono/diheme cytochrome c family protein